MSGATRLRTATKRFQISERQLALLVFALGLGVDPFKLPSLLMRHFGARNAWWGEVPALGVALWGVAVTIALSRRFHGQPLNTTVLATLGPYLGYAYLGALVALCLGRVANVVLVFAPLARLDLLPRLPLAFICVMVAAVGGYAAYSGIEPVARIAEVLASLFAIGLAGIYLPLLFHGHIGHIVPLRLPPGSKWFSVPVLGAAGTIRGFIPLLFLGPVVTRPPTGGRFSIAIILAWLLVVASILIPPVLFGPHLASQLRYPFLAATSTSSWRWLPVRNLVSLTLFTWYGIALLVFATNLWMATWLLGCMLPVPCRRIWVVVFAAGAGIAASIPRSDGSLRPFFDALDIADLVFGVVAPTIIWALGKQRNIRA